MGAAGFMAGLSGSSGPKSVADKIKKHKQYSKSGTDMGGGGAESGDFGGASVPSDGSADPEIGSFKKGGKVKKTGKYKLHAGERVLNSKQTRKYDRKK